MLLFLIALSAVLGAILTYFFSGAIVGLIAPAFAIVAGNFLYIAAVDLVPELHEAEHAQRKIASLVQVMLIVAGIALVSAGEFLLGH